MKLRVRGVICSECGCHALAMGTLGQRRARYWQWIGYAYLCHCFACTAVYLILFDDDGLLKTVIRNNHMFLVSAGTYEYRDADIPF